MSPSAVERHIMSLRLPKDMADQIELIAAVDGHSANEAITAAVGRYIRRRNLDPAFRAALAAYIARIRTQAEAMLSRDLSE